MRHFRHGWFRLVAMTTMVSLVAGCSEVNRRTSPIELLATVSQNIQIVDLADVNCGDLGTITLRSIIKNPTTTSTPLLDIRLQTMRVSYVRTDGGTLVPAPFVRTISGLITAGGTSQLNDFLVFQQDAFVQAPFVALFPNNDGFDPETGRSVVDMDVIIDIFGETLGGENVSARARFPLSFCFDCGGCV